MVVNPDPSLPLSQLPQANHQEATSALASGIGIVGGGQLALMLAEAAQRQGVPIHVQTPGAADPAVGLASTVIQAEIDDASSTRELSQRCVAISFENEWVDLDALAPLEEAGVVFLPSLESLWPLVDKRQQRELLGRLSIPTPRWLPLQALKTPVRAPSLGGIGPFGDPEDAATMAAAGQAWDLPSPDPTAAALADAPGATDHANPLAPEAPGDSGGGRSPQPPGRLPQGWSFPVVAKAIRGGYDGKGTRMVRSEQELGQLLEQVDAALWILEEFVAFERELAIVACRDRAGSVACYPLVETHQHRHVCDWVLAPAQASQALEAMARNMAASLLTALDYVGVLSIEFFYGSAGLLVNELAPRTHNSGHYSIEACTISQFAQQVRIVSGQPLQAPELSAAGALMVNLLGTEQGDAETSAARAALAALPGASLHWYGKQGSALGRKLGHVTVLLQACEPGEREREARQRLEQIRTIWPRPEHDWS